MRASTLKRLFRSFGLFTEPLGYIAVPLFSIIVPRKSIENSIHLLGWYDITPEMVGGTAIFIGLLVGLPIAGLLGAIAGGLGVMVGLMTGYLVGGYIYQLVDEKTFRLRYDFTIFTPLALEVMALELMRSNDKDSAISRLADYNLGYISRMVEKMVIKRFRKNPLIPSKYKAFVDWLTENPPSEFFRYYALQLLSYDEVDEVRFKQLVDDAQNRMYSILEDRLSSSSMRMQLMIVFGSVSSAMFVIILPLIASMFRINTPIAISIFLFFLIVIDLPLLTYLVSSSSLRRYYVIDEFRL